MSSLMLLIAALGITAQPVAAAGGTFWLFDGANQSGEYRSFQLNPNRLTRFGVGGTGGIQFYNQNCSGACNNMENTVSSMQVDCSSFDSNDRIVLYDTQDGHTALYTIVGCTANASGNQMKFNLPTSANNKAGSMTTQE